MEHAANLILIDSDMHRRATISHTFSARRVHVEPFETVGELSQSWPRSGIVLIHDEPGTIAELFSQMGRCREWFPVVAFSESPKAGQIVAAIHLGALDYVEWPCDEFGLLEVLERAEAHAEEFSNARLRETIARSRIEKLTARERQVLDGVASGLSNRLIGERLSISPRTVEIHRANMLNKLGAKHTSEAIRIAIEAYLIS